MLLKAIASSPPTSLSASTSNFKGCLGVNSKNMIFIITNNKTFDHQMFFGQEDGKLIFVGKGVLERIPIIASEARSRNDGSFFFFWINTSGEMLNPVLTCVWLTHLTASLLAYLSFDGWMKCFRFGLRMGLVPCLPLVTLRQPSIIVRAQDRNNCWSEKNNCFNTGHGLFPLLWKNKSFVLRHIQIQKYMNWLFRKMFFYWFHEYNNAQPFRV